MYPEGRRVDDKPSQWIPRHADPTQERNRVAAVLRERGRMLREAQARPDTWPAPEVPMRVVEPGALRGGAARLLSKLRSAHWGTVVTYARGTAFDAQKRPGAVVSSWAIRASKDNRRAVAIWWERANGRMESKGVLTWGVEPVKWVGVEEFESGVA